MLKRLSIATAISLLALVGSPARAQFGGIGAPKVPSAGGSGGATPEQIDKFMKEATNASGLVDAASISLYRAVASKNEVDALDAQISAANKLADPQEKKAKLEEINRSTLAKTANMKFNEIAEAVKKEHNDKKSAAINASLYNLGLGGLQDADLVSTGKKLVSGTPSPAIAGKIPEVKQTIEKLVAQGDSISKILGNSTALMTTVGLRDLPKSASSPARQVNLQ